MNSKLRDILEQHANWAHRWGKDNPDTYIYGTPTFKPRALETVEAEKAIRQAVGEEMLELVDSCFEDNNGYIDDKLRQTIKQWQGGEDA